MANCFVCVVLGLAYVNINVTPCVGNDWDSASMSDSTGLRTDIIDANDHRFRPIKNQSASIVVSVEFHLFQLLHIDELEMKMKISCAFHFQWMDEIRVWSPSNYSGIRAIHPDPKDVWRPRIFISNSLGDRDVFKDSYAHLSVMWNGRTRWKPGVNLITSCNLNLRFYPFDEQTCYIYALTSSFSQEVVFTKSRTTAFMDEFTENGEWSLIGTKIDSYVVGEGLESFSVLRITVFLRRDSKFFFINWLFPTMMLSILSLMVFVLPRSSGERAGYCMTVLLSLSLIQSAVSSQLPQTPQTFPYIVMYLFSLLILSWMMVISTILVLVWHNRQENEYQGNNRGFDDSFDQKLIAQMEENFVPLDSGFTVDGNSEKESLKAFYAPLGPDYSSSQATEDRISGGSHRKFVFLRDFRKLHPTDSETNTLNSEHSTENRTNCIQFITSKMASACRFLLSDIDIILFCIFLILWLAVSIVFMLLMTGG